MIARFVRPASGASRAVSGWADYLLALSMACIEYVRLPKRPVTSPEPVLVAQAMTLNGGRAIVHPVHDPGGRFAIGPVATIAIAAAALASTLGANSILSSGYGRSVAVLAGDPVMLSLAGSPTHGNHASDSLPASLADSAAPIEAVAIVPAASDTALLLTLTDHASASSAEVSADPVIPVQLESPVIESDKAVLDGVATDPAPPAPVAPEPAVEPAVEPVAEALAPEPEPAVVVTPALPEAISHFEGVTYTDQEVKALALEAGWAPDQLDNLVSVAWCESRWKPAARGVSALGLMQVMPFWFEIAGVELAQWSNPLANLRVALVAYEADLGAGRAPWAAWQCLPIGGVGAASTGS